jgi:hypothetical protein
MFSRKRNTSSTKRGRPLHDLAPASDDEDDESPRSAARRATFADNEDKYNRNNDRAGNMEPAPGSRGRAVQ